MNEKLLKSIKTDEAKDSTKCTKADWKAYQSTVNTDLTILENQEGEYSAIIQKLNYRRYTKRSSNQPGFLCVGWHENKTQSKIILIHRYHYDGY